jgi:hypothetical protein
MVWSQIFAPRTAMIVLGVSMTFASFNTLLIPALFCERTDLVQLFMTLTGLRELLIGLLLLIMVIYHENSSLHHLHHCIVLSLRNHS